MYKKAIAGLVVVLTLGLLFVSIPQAKAQFVIASWAYPDEYGQGIYQIRLNENSTGDWLTFGDAIEYGDSTTIAWNVSVGIKLFCYTRINNTLIGAIDLEDGENYQKHNVVVTLGNGTIVFSQQNFTKLSSNDYSDPYWTYAYFVVLNFLPEQGQIYTVTVTYEVFY